MQEETSLKLRELLETRPNLRQEDVAKNAGVSQATVSRALKTGLKRRTMARDRLFRYIQKELGTHTFNDQGRQKVVDAFGEIWDGSDAHASAIAKIITASKGLRPSRGKG